MSERKHKWVDVRGWGGARAGTEQCDFCNRVRSPEQADAARRANAEPEECA